MKMSERTKWELICGGFMIVFFAIVILGHAVAHPSVKEQEEVVTQAYEYLDTETMV